MKNMFKLLLALAIIGPGLCRAGDDKKALLTRDEVGVFKKKLVTVLDALGLPPAGFVKQKDDFSLPTEWYKEKGSLVSNHAGANRKFAINLNSAVRTEKPGPEARFRAAFHAENARKSCSGSSATAFPCSTAPQLSVYQ